MTVYTWNNVGGGDFDIATNWLPDTAFPTTSDTADLTNAFSGADYTVSVSGTAAAELLDIDVGNVDFFVADGGIYQASTIDATLGTLNIGGEITGGTINYNNNAVFLAQGGTLDGVTWQGTLALDAVGVSNALTVTTGLDVLNAAGNGPGTIEITGSGADLDFDSSMTLNGTGGNLLINIGTSTTQNQFLSINTDDTLTLGTAVSVSQIAAGSTIDISNEGGASGGMIVNDGTMSFSSGAGSGAFINPSNFINNGLMTLTGGGGATFAGEDLEVTPLNSLTIGATGQLDVSDFGFVHLEGPNGSVDISGTIAISGMSTVDLDTASTSISDLSGTGVVEISTGSTAQINYDYDGSVAFLDATGALALGQEGGAYTGTIAGMSLLNSTTRDVIDLLLTTSVTGVKPVFTTTTGGVLDVMDNTTTIASINLLGNYENQMFNFGTNGAGGTDIFMGCFASGTGIATPSGEVAVEELRASQSVLIAEGSAAPIVWLGQRHIDCRRHLPPESVWPVRIRAGAFGDRSPCRDLWLSPDHAVFVDDVLIPVKHLINGTSIEQVRVTSVTYYHVELPSHDLLLAEGLAVESYLDVGDRSNFSNGGVMTRQFADFDGDRADPGAVWEAFGRAPMVVTGPILHGVRHHLADRAAARSRPLAVGASI